MRKPPTRTRAGLNLVEIMLATFILAVVMIPILQLIFGGVKDTARGRDRATAVDLAANIMTQLLDKVPFSAFKPDEGPEIQDVQAFFNSDKEEAGLLAGRKQCLLEALDSDWERILDQDKSAGDGVRTVLKNGTTFEVILFAGIYKDEGGTTTTTGGYNVPKLKGELTFSFFRNPYIDLTPSERAAARELVVMDTNPPYEQVGKDISGVQRVDDPRLSPGWPCFGSGCSAPAASDKSEEITPENFYKGLGNTKVADLTDSEDPNDACNIHWPRHSLDLRDFREESGSMLKLVLGIRWRPGVAGGEKTGYAKTTKEFWLVSFKSKLEEN